MSATSHSRTGRTLFAWPSLPRPRAGSWADVLLKRVRGRVHRLRRARKNHARQEAIEAATRAIAYYNAREYDRAEVQFRAATSKDGTYARAFYGLGNTLAKLGKNTEARMAWMKAAEVDPESECAAKAQEKLKRRA
jgi:tetratricopeptide (TPR) repeat protein